MFEQLNVKALVSRASYRVAPVRMVAALDRLTNKLGIQAFSAAGSFQPILQLPGKLTTSRA
jgi:hypothetical protein